MCTQTLDEQGSISALSDDEAHNIRNDILTNAFGSKGYRSLAIAYKDMDADSFENLKWDNDEFKTEENRAVLE